jgi:hypothetical protein
MNAFEIGMKLNGPEYARVRDRAREIEVLEQALAENNERLRALEAEQEREKLLEADAALRPTVGEERELSSNATKFTADAGAASIPNTENETPDSFSAIRIPRRRWQFWRRSKSEGAHCRKLSAQDAKPVK